MWIPIENATLGSSILLRNKETNIEQAWTIFGIFQSVVREEQASQNFNAQEEKINNNYQ